MNNVEKGFDVDVFVNIYKDDLWGAGSGYGSLYQSNKQLIQFIEKFLADFEIEAVFDFGCGDWQYMSQVKMPRDLQYYGYDIVKKVIDDDIDQYGNHNTHFFLLDPSRILEDFIASRNSKGLLLDLLIVKDVLMHWKIDDISRFCFNVLPHFKYALLINDGSNDIFYPGVKEIKTGDFRPLNLFDQNIAKPLVGNWDMIFSYYNSVGAVTWHKEVILYSILTIKEHLSSVYKAKLFSQEISKDNSHTNGIMNFHLYHSSPPADQDLDNNTEQISEGYSDIFDLLLVH